MKKIISIIFIAVLLITSTQVAYADDEVWDTDITSSDFTDNFDPTKTESTGWEDKILEQFEPAVNKILRIIQVIGAILAVLAIALWGFQMIFTSNEEMTGPLGLNYGFNRKEKAPSDQRQIRNWMWGALIGSILLFSSGAVVRIVYNLFMKG